MALAHRTTRAPRRRTSMLIPRERESSVRLRSERAAIDADDLRALATATDAAAQGLSVCARRAGSREVAADAAALAQTLGALAARAKERVPGGMRRASTSERLRWEWLASTAALLDGGAERRIAEEVARHLAQAETVAARLDDDDGLEDASEHLRRAAVFCRSLAAPEPVRAQPFAAVVRL